jgi:hypothetical protein
MTENILVCANHPTRETNLRCNRCGNPICAQCAVQTPVGYRCRDCVRGQQKVFETARQIDFPIAAVVSAVIVGLAAALLSYLSFWGLFLAPVVGGGIAEVIRAVIGRRRGQNLPLAAALGGVLGLLTYLFYAIFPTLRWMFLASGGFQLSALTGIASSLIWPTISGFLMISSMYYRLRGIRI